MCSKFIAYLKYSRGYDCELCGYFSHKLDAYIHMELKTKISIFKTLAMAARQSWSQGDVSNLFYFLPFDKKKYLKPNFLTHTPKNIDNNMCRS